MVTRQTRRRRSARRKGSTVIVCRCEDVTETEIRRAIRAGYCSLAELKHLFRVGMGHCQGRGCLRNIMRIIEEETGIRIPEQQLPSARPPLKPLPLGLLSRYQPPSDGWDVPDR